MDRDGPCLEAECVAGIKDNKQFVKVLASRDFEAILRIVDSKTGASLDRTIFRDLIHWGATGWLLASLPAAVDQGWIKETMAKEIAYKILGFVADDSIWGDAPSGKIGNSRGIMYRFGGIDPNGLDGPLTGTRKIDKGNKNVIEASVIDTALFQFGVATLASGFPSDAKIQTMSRSILNRTLWDEIIDSKTGQIYMAWSPQQGKGYNIPAAFGGFWADHGDSDITPITLDSYTDEAAMVAILACGSETHPVSPLVWYSMIRSRGQGSCSESVVSLPGAWFTYSFHTATYLNPDLGKDKGSHYGTIDVDWFQNSKQIFNCIQKLTNGAIFLPDAVELPNGNYVAQSFPESASKKDPKAQFLRSRSPYSLQLAIGLGDETAKTAILGLRAMLKDLPEIWDPLLGFLDAFDNDLESSASLLQNKEALTRKDEKDEKALIRKEGQWIQQQVFPLNKGAALLSELNYIADGIIWKTANRHTVIKRGINLIYNRNPSE